jgi:hypothetical protein
VRVEVLGEEQLAVGVVAVLHRGAIRLPHQRSLREASSGKSAVFRSNFECRAIHFATVHTRPDAFSSLPASFQPGTALSATAALGNPDLRPTFFQTLGLPYFATAAFKGLQTCHQPPENGLELNWLHPPHRFTKTSFSIGQGSVVDLIRTPEHLEGAHSY